MVETGEQDGCDSSFARLESSLERIGAAVGAAEADGILWGMLGASGEVTAEDWIDEVLGPTVAAGPEEAEGRSRLAAALAEAQRVYASDRHEFEPMLPADETSIATRSRALGRWCGGFLAGVGLSGLRDLADFPEDAREFLADVTQIARLETDPEVTEASEVAYTELVEFIRVGVMLMIEEPLAGGAGR